MTHICVSKLTIIGSDNGLAPGRRQAIIETNSGILLIKPVGKNLNDLSIRIQTFSFKKMHLKMSSAKWYPFCLGLNVLITYSQNECWCSISRSCIRTEHLLTITMCSFHHGRLGMLSLICVQLIKSLWPRKTIRRHRTWSLSDVVRAFRMFSAKPLSEPMLSYYKTDP